MTTITSYKYINNSSKNTILFLHGWGCSIKYMEPVAFINTANSLIIDLPGFGNNEKLSKPYNLDDYVNDILSFLNENNYNITHIVAHSFGGKIAVLLSKKIKLKALILIAPSIFHKLRGPRYYFKIFVYKLIKNNKRLEFLKNKLGSSDYKNCSGVLKKTMSNVINTSVCKDIKSIAIPTLLIFGKKDKITPIYLGKKIKRKIKDCELIAISGNHFAYLYNKKQTILIIESMVTSSC